MYNGIGLATVRGSASSGHVQKSHAYVKPEFFRSKMSSNAGGITNIDGDGAENPDSMTTLTSNLSSMRKDRKNTEILDHRKMREIEGKVYELRDRLEGKGTMSEKTIDKHCDELREELTVRMSKHASSSRVDSADNSYDTSNSKRPGAGAEQWKGASTGRGDRADMRRGVCFDYQRRGECRRGDSCKVRTWWYCGWGILEEWCLHAE